MTTRNKIITRVPANLLRTSTFYEPTDEDFAFLLVAERQNHAETLRHLAEEDNNHGDEAYVDITRFM